jgi:hypothetical protein
MLSKNKKLEEDKRINIYFIIGLIKLEINGYLDDYLSYYR